MASMGAHRLLLCAALAGSGAAQNMGQWVGGEHCAGSHCGPGKEERQNAATTRPAPAPTCSTARRRDDMEPLTGRWVHAVVDGSTVGKAMAGACAGDKVEFLGMLRCFPRSSGIGE